MKTTAIILAAGKGTRMQMEVAKQYLEICGKPVLYYALRAFEESCVDEIILVTAKEDISYCKEHIVKKYGFGKIQKIIAGGKERYDSVYQGLCSIKESDYVFIHDGARPFITKEEINHLLECVSACNACVAGMPVKDTIKIVDGSGNVKQTPDRNRVWLVQTPQVFQYALIRRAYDRMMEEGTDGITDDAMAVEHFTNHAVKLVPASYRNIKITTPEDVLIAEAFLSHMPFL